MPSDEQAVGLYTPVQKTFRHFCKHPCLGITYFRTIIDLEGNNRVLHTPYFFCFHCKQGGGTVVTPMTAWHQVLAGHMSTVRSEGAMVSEEYLEHMKFNAQAMGFAYHEQWHRSMMNLCNAARRAQILLCLPIDTIDKAQDQLLGNAEELPFPSFRNGATCTQREFLYRSIGLDLNAPICWRCTPTGWMTSGMIVASSQRNLHIYRNPVMQVAGAGTPDDPEHCIIDENLTTRAHGTRRVYCSRYQLER